MNATRKTMKAASALLAILLGLASSGLAFAWHHGSHVRYGVVVGGPLWWGPGYYAPYPYYPGYYYPPYYPAAPAGPSVYVEQGALQPAPAVPPETGVQPAPATQPQTYDWYYCVESKAYYPYVKECPGPWQRVAPQPPPG